MRRKCSGTKQSTEIVDSPVFGPESGRGALPLQRRCAVRPTGAMGGENVGVSNRKTSEILVRRKPKVSSAMAIIGG
jgi:hypothetical protein